MNAEIIKAMNKKETKANKIRKWWNNNDYKVWRVILFPIWIVTIIKDKTNKWLNSRQVWNEERAKKIFNYYIPRRAEWDNETKSFYFFDNGYGWGKSARRYLKRKDYRFWKVHSNSKMRYYLIEQFELEGFAKEVGDCSQGWTEITFKMIEREVE